MIARLAEGARPQEKSGPRTRERVVRAAGRLFRHKGYEQTTVRDIAEAVGLQSGSLFFHFHSKEEILLTVIEGGLRRAVVVLEQYLSQASSPQERLAALLQGHLQAVLEEEPDAFHVVLYEWRSLSDPARQRVIALRDEYESHVAQVLEQLAAKGLVPQDTRMFRLFLLGALNWTLQWYKPGGELSVRALAEEFLGFLSVETVLR